MLFASEVQKQRFFWVMTYSQWIKRTYVILWRWRDVYTDSSPSFRIHVVLLSDGSFFTVDAKRFCTQMCGFGQKAYELTDGSIITVGVKCFRHAEVLSSQLAESTSHRSRATKNATCTSTLYLYDKLFQCSLLLSASSCSSRRSTLRCIRGLCRRCCWAHRRHGSGMCIAGMLVRCFRAVFLLKQVSAVRAVDHRFPIKSARVSTPWLSVAGRPESGRTFGSHEFQGADPRTEPMKNWKELWLFLVVLRARGACLLVAVAVSWPGAPVPLSLSLGLWCFLLPCFRFRATSQRPIISGLRPRASHSCSWTGGTSGRSRGTDPRTGFFRYPFPQRHCTC